MDLQLTEEQIIFRDMVRALCTTHCDTGVVRAMEKHPAGVDANLWQQMSETGLLGLYAPEQYGGLGMSLSDCAIIYQELGRALAPGPYFVSSVMAANALAKSGSEAQQSTWLPAISNGSAVITPAWLEPDNSFAAEGVQLEATLAGELYTLNGVKRHVEYARGSTLLVLVRTGSAPTAIDLLLIESDTAGVELEQQHTMAYDTQYKVSFNQVQVPVANRLGEPQSGWDTWQACMLEGVVLLAAWAVGGAQRALEMTVEYSKIREQFDQPIGAFQSLAHYMADAAAVLAGAEVLVQETAWAHSAGKSIDRLSPMSKLAACNAFRDTMASCEQIFGGYGFTLEYDIQLYFRRAKQLQLNWWDSRHLEQLIAADVLDSAGETIPDPLLV